MLKKIGLVAYVGFIAVLAAGCVGSEPEAEEGELATGGGATILTEAQAKQRVLDLYGKLGVGDLDGFVAGLKSDAIWHVNAETLPWGGGDRIGPAGVKAFFLEVLGIVSITQFAPLPEATIVQRTGPCKFSVILKANEGLASVADPSQTVSFTIREAVTLLCNGKIADADIYYDTGAVEHMLLAAGDLP